MYLKDIVKKIRKKKIIIKKFKSLYLLLYVSLIHLKKRLENIFNGLICTVTNHNFYIFTFVIN